MLTTQVPSTEPPHIGDVPYGNLSRDLLVDAFMCERFFFFFFPFFFFLRTVKTRRVTAGRGGSPEFKCATQREAYVEKY